MSVWRCCTAAFTNRPPHTHSKSSGHCTGSQRHLKEVALLQLLLLTPLLVEWAGPCFYHWEVLQLFATQLPGSATAETAEPVSWNAPDAAERSTSSTAFKRCEVSSCRRRALEFVLWGLKKKLQISCVSERGLLLRQSRVSKVFTGQTQPRSIPIIIEVHSQVLSEFATSATSWLGCGQRGSASQWPYMVTFFLRTRSLHPVFWEPVPTTTRPHRSTVWHTGKKTPRKRKGQFIHVGKLFTLRSFTCLAQLTSTPTSSSFYF